MNIGFSGAILSVFDKYPSMGITGLIASLGGVGAATLAILKVITVFAGAAGAVFGCLAGFYTFLYYRNKVKEQKNDPKA